MPLTAFYTRQNVRVPIQPNIGLDTTARQSVIEMLNLLLADESVLAHNTHHAEGRTGRISGSDLHSLYDAQFKQVNELASEISERVKILGGAPFSGPEELFNRARLDGKLAGVPGVMSILADHEAFIRFLREDAQQCSEVYEDQGTFALLVSIMRLHEKMAWMLRAYIEPEQSGDKSREIRE
jgi:starvation-inducible DNA-binding protein